MCYPGNLLWISTILSPELVRDKRVLDVGAYDVNGTCRTVVEPMKPSIYWGIDNVPGPSVDAAMDFSLPNALDNLYFDDKRMDSGAFDIVICLNTLEHARNWRGLVNNLKKSVKIGGLLVFSVPDARFPYHNPPDYWRFEIGQVRSMFSDMTILQCFTDAIPCTNLVAIKTNTPPIDLDSLQPSEVRKA